MAAMDIKRDVKPNKNFLGKFVVKSLSSSLEMKMAQNISKEITEQKRATSGAIAKILPVSCFTPADEAKATVAISAAIKEQELEVLFSHCSPPGTEAVEAKATVAISAAMKEQELDVLFSHCLLSSSSSRCSAWKILSGEFPVRLFLTTKSGSKEFCTYCIEPSAYF